ncbi:MAG: DUF4854 domain-containing protein [Mogibacterium sp.]|nr:DUF4854 domain-containing protein [Mogibacterium sp.]
MLAAFAVAFASCADQEAESEPMTFESFINADPSILESVDAQLVSGQSSDISYEIKGNEISYTFEMSGTDGMTEDIVNSDIVKESLETGMKNQASSFKSLANSLAGISKIDGIRIIVSYTYNGDTVLTETFEADPLPSDEDSPDDIDA